MTEKPRIATRDDEPEIIRLLHLMHAESGILSLDEGRAREMFARCFDRRGGIIGVIGVPGALQAMIYLLISSFWYTSDNHLEELFNYVHPDHRGSGYAKAMIQFAKSCSDEIKIPLVIGVLTNRRMEAKVRLYRQVLGTPAGAFFVYNTTWQNEGGDEFWNRRPSRAAMRERRNGKEAHS